MHARSFVHLYKIDVLNQLTVTCLHPYNSYRNDLQSHRKQKHYQLKLSLCCLYIIFNQIISSNRNICITECKFVQICIAMCSNPSFKIYCDPDINLICVTIYSYNRQNKNSILEQNIPEQEAKLQNESLL